MFPVGAVRTDYPAKQRILGIEVDGAAKAYALDDLAKQFGVLEDRIGGSTVQIEVSDQGEVTAVLDGSGRHLPHVFVFWFAWQAFNPETEVYAF
jgi:hypothetical protein